jgi:hypothetical protein
MMTNFDFRNFASALSVTDKTAEYEIVEWGETPKPVLIVKPAGSENKPYFNALLKELGGNARAMKSQRLTGEALEKAREVTAKLFPGLVVVGWRNVKDASGADVPFSAEACSHLLEVLNKTAPYVLDGLRAFCDEPQSFLATAEQAIDAEELAGNLQSA